MRSPISPSSTTASHSVNSRLTNLVTVLLIVMVMMLASAAAAWAQQVSVSVDGPTPNPLTIESGQSVEFVNETDEPVRLVDDMGRWDSGALESGDTFAITFEEVGDVSYGSQDGTVSGVISVVPADTVVDTLPNTGLTTSLLATIGLVALAAGMILLRRTA